jgi:hypothetical protein
MDLKLTGGVNHVVLVGDVFDTANAMRRNCSVTRRCLQRLGLWRRDRLSIAVGNHDIFHLAWREALATINADAGDSHEWFTEWIAELLNAGDLLNSSADGVFPYRKHLGPVTLFVGDTTATNTMYSNNGYWRSADDHAIRRAVRAGDGRRVLAIHHPPLRDAERSLVAQGLGMLLRSAGVRGSTRWGPKLAFGFPEPSYRRLEKLVDDVGFGAIVCGHLHYPGRRTYRWQVGEQATAYLKGWHRGAPTIGLLSIPEHGRLGWKELACL